MQDRYTYEEHHLRQYRGTDTDIVTKAEEHEDNQRLQSNHERE